MSMPPLDFSVPEPSDHDIAVVIKGLEAVAVLVDQQRSR
jgi:hypothetical protein